MYGYNNDEKSSGSASFGLNQGVFMTKFEFNPNGGKDGAAQDCLDITFEFPGGAVRNYRQFPVTQAVDKEGNKVTNPKSKEMIAAFNEFNSKITQIMKCYVTEEVLKRELTAANNFKSFCQILSNTLPKEFAEIPVDVFCQYQWQPKTDGETKYLEIPKNVKQGKVFAAAEEGNFKAVHINKEAGIVTYNGNEYPLTVTGKSASFTIGEKAFNIGSDKGLIYIAKVGDEIKTHSITRTGWFMDSNWAKTTNEDAPIQSSWD